MTAVNVTLPSLYEYYTGGGINSGLSVNQSYFTLNNRNISIYSGAVHYFRVPKPYWRDRLRKLRASGLNTVETYIPWNLHEPEDGHYDFGQGGSDMQDFLDVQEFLNIAQEEDLLALIRPGPYICAEWEFGGFPSWLLRKQNLKIRTSDQVYMQYVRRFFNMLLPILAMFQFTKGGPIIGFQVENEYGSTERKGKFVPDRIYLEQLRDIMLKNGIVELLYTSDSPTMHGDAGTLPGILFQTANFKSNPEAEFNKLKQLQPGKPSMAMEFWSGWFDHWSETHHVTNYNDFYDTYERILKYPASVNLYMFHGGTNWGFLNGANLDNDALDNSGLQPDTTSYDYDAPLTENGDYTDKYVAIKNLIALYNPVPTRLPNPPLLIPRKKYNNIKITQQLPLSKIIEQISDSFMSPYIVPMELFDINNKSGQSYGYNIYRQNSLAIPANSTLSIMGHVCDTVVVVLNNHLWSKPLRNIQDLNGFGYWRMKDSSLFLGPLNFTQASLVILLENYGRVGFGANEQFKQYKGIWQGRIYLNNQELTNWEIFPLEFKKKWTNNLTGWQPFTGEVTLGPRLYKSNFYVDEVQDTFIDMRTWCKGIVIVNGFVLGRYTKLGPQQTLYFPAPLMKQGNNTILIFEHFSPGNEIAFSDKPIYFTPK